MKNKIALYLFIVGLIGQGLFTTSCSKQQHQAILPEGEVVQQGMDAGLKKQLMEKMQNGDIEGLSTLIKNNKASLDADDYTTLLGEASSQAMNMEEIKKLLDTIKRNPTGEVPTTGGQQTLQLGESSVVVTQQPKGCWQGTKALFSNFKEDMVTYAEHELKGFKEHPGKKCLICCGICCTCASGLATFALQTFLRLEETNIFNQIMTSRGTNTTR